MAGHFSSISHCTDGLGQCTINAEIYAVFTGPSAYIYNGHGPLGMINGRDF